MINIVKSSSAFLFFQLYIDKLCVCCEQDERMSAGRGFMTCTMRMGTNPKKDDKMLAITHLISARDDRIGCHNFKNMLGFRNFIVYGKLKNI